MDRGISNDYHSIRFDSLVAYGDRKEDYTSMAQTLFEVGIARTEGKVPPSSTPLSPHGCDPMPMHSGGADYVQL